VRQLFAVGLNNDFCVLGHQSAEVCAWSSALLLLLLQLRVDRVVLPAFVLNVRAHFPLIVLVRLLARSVRILWRKQRCRGRLTINAVEDLSSEALITRRLVLCRWS